MGTIVAIIALLIGNVIGIVIGIVFGIIWSYRPTNGRLKITSDDDGTYCFLVLNEHPDELKDKETVTLKVERTPHR